MARRVYGGEGEAKQERVRFGFLSDSHYANVDYAWSGDDRFFFASLAKMRAAVAKFNELKLDMAVEGGDMTDWSRVGASAEGEKDEALTNAAFDEFEAEFLKFNGPCYHVPGNHDFCSFASEEFYSRVKNAGAPMTEGYYEGYRVRHGYHSKLPHSIHHDHEEELHTNRLGAASRGRIPRRAGGRDDRAGRQADGDASRAEFRRHA